jgi:hypothetical protein
MSTQAHENTRCCALDNGQRRLALGLIGSRALYLRSFDRDFPFALPPYHCPAGIVPMIVGGFLVLRCRAILSTRVSASPATDFFRNNSWQPFPSAIPPQCYVARGAYITVRSRVLERSRVAARACNLVVFTISSDRRGCGRAGTREALGRQLSPARKLRRTAGYLSFDTSRSTQVETDWFRDRALDSDRQLSSFFIL